MFTISLLCFWLCCCIFWFAVGFFGLLMCYSPYSPPYSPIHTIQYIQEANTLYMVLKHSKESAKRIHQRRYVALVDSSAWPFQGDERELVFERRGNALLSGRPFVFQHQPFFWLNSFIVGKCSVPPASILSNTIERNCDYYYCCFNCLRLAWFQFFSLFLPTLCCVSGGRISPHAVSVCCFHDVCDVHGEWSCLD